MKQSRKERQVNIRTANTEDLNKLAALNKQVHDIHVKIEPEFFCDISQDSIRASILKSLEDDESTILVAEQGETLTGYMLLKKRVRSKNDLMHERKCVYIDQICVYENYRNQGVFNQLLAKAKELAKEWGFSRLELDVWSNNVDAKASFTRSGFTPYNEKMKLEL